MTRKNIIITFIIVAFFAFALWVLLPLQGSVELVYQAYFTANATAAEKDAAFDKAITDMHLDPGKKTLLVTGASTGSARINEVVCRLLERLAAFSDSWQIVHLTGLHDFKRVDAMYRTAHIHHAILGYYDNMSDLLAAADLVIGRSGAVSVAEYAAAAVPAICIPYPHHADRHQYLNAATLVKAGAAVIVDDVPDSAERAARLWTQLHRLMSDDCARQGMHHACKAVAKFDTDTEIANRLLDVCG